MADISRDFAKTAGKHFVSLSCVQRQGLGEEKLLMFSGFVIEAFGEWMYVTAGHILRDIQKALDSGSSFDIWRLGDQTAGNKFKDTAIPYSFEISEWLVVEDEDIGLDYATTPLPMLTRLALAAGDVQPLGNSAWGDHLTDSDHWALLGVASETVEYDGVSEIRARFSLTPLVEAPPPDGAEVREANQFYARFAPDAEVKIEDADGLSGSPVFALKKVDGKWLYNVIGVQSGWYRTSRVLAVCPISSFALEVEKIVQEVHQQRALASGS